MGSISSFTFPVLCRSTSVGTKPLMAVASSSDDDGATKSKLLTFLGKGGSGKTTAAIFAAQVQLYMFNNRLVLEPPISELVLILYNNNK